MVVTFCLSLSPSTQSCLMHLAPGVVELCLTLAGAMARAFGPSEYCSQRDASSCDCSGHLGTQLGKKYASGEVR